MDAFDDQTCRVCLQPDSGCIKITSSINVRFGKISDMVLFSTGVEMTVNEELPQLICNECALHLNVAYGFKKKVINAEKIFLDAILENEDRKRPPPQLVVAATNGDDLLESQMEVEQKNIPIEHEMGVDAHQPLITGSQSEEEGPEVKYIQANLASFFNTNELIELSDTDSDTVEDVEIIHHQRTSVLLSQLQSQHTMTDPNAPLECPVCPQMLPDPIAFNEHLNAHPEKRCKKCNRMCYYSSSLQLHFRTHANEITIQCPQCEYTAPSQSLMQSHIRQAHYSPARPASVAYQCKNCDRMFMNVEKLRNHLHTDHNFNIVSDAHALTFANEVDRAEMSRCKVCGRQLSSYRCLIVHMRLHERDKLNFCYVCQESFRHDQNMYLHFKSQHPGQKPYKCSGHCSQTFDTLRLYDAHMRHAKTHKFAQPTTKSTAALPPRTPIRIAYDCYVCEENFSNSSDQITHMKTHSRFPCKKCHQPYMKWKTLYDHYEQYHPNGEWTGNFVCPTCHRKFPTTRSLSNHERSHKMNMTH